MRLLLWQVPVGNQVYATEDNTSGQATSGYMLRIGVFVTDWSAFWAWNGHAASFSVN